MNQAIRVTLPALLLRTAEKIAREENRTRDEVLASALTQYQRDLETLRTVQRAGQRAARAASIRSLHDVDRLVHQMRVERRRRARRS